VSEVNLDDTSNCPLQEICIDCGKAGWLEVRTFSSMVGVFCLTMCDDCARPRRPSFSVTTAVRRSLEHCGHLGIDADQMAALMEQERIGDRDA
jgi:hypothetical protein